MILLISGSVQPRSRTLAAVEAAAAALRERGLRARIWDLSETPLPIADPRYHASPMQYPDVQVRRLVEAATAATGFVLASPLYHNAYCGALKNCLDHLSIGQFAEKPVGLISFGGTLTAIQVCDQLQIVVRGLYGLALPVQVVTVPADFARTPDGAFRLVGEDPLRRLAWLADQIRSHVRGGGPTRSMSRWREGHVGEEPPAALPASDGLPGIDLPAAAHGP